MSISQTLNATGLSKPFSSRVHVVLKVIYWTQRFTVMWWFVSCELSAGIVFVRLAHFTKSRMIVLSSPKNRHQTIIKDDRFLAYSHYQPVFVIYRRSLVLRFAATAVSSRSLDLYIRTIVNDSFGCVHSSDRPKRLIRLPWITKHQLFVTACKVYACPHHIVQQQSPEMTFNPVKNLLFVFHLDVILTQTLQHKNRIQMKHLNPIKTAQNVFYKAVLIGQEHHFFHIRPLFVMHSMMNRILRRGGNENGRSQRNPRWPLTVICKCLSGILILYFSLKQQRFPNASPPWT